MLPKGLNSHSHTDPHLEAICHQNHRNYSIFAENRLMSHNENDPGDHHAIVSSDRPYSHRSNSSWLDLTQPETEDLDIEAQGPLREIGPGFAWKTLLVLEILNILAFAYWQLFEKSTISDHLWAHRLFLNAGARLQVLSSFWHKTCNNRQIHLR